MRHEEDQILIIERGVWRRILQHAETDYPSEACGVLLSPLKHPNQVVEVYPVKNLVADRRNDRYMVDPQDLLKVTKEAESNELEVVGSYHSHPDHPALPSPYDLTMAWNDYVYLIVSISEGKFSEAKAWVLDDTSAGFKEKPVHLTTKKHLRSGISPLCKERHDDPAHSQEADPK